VRFVSWVTNVKSIRIAPLPMARKEKAARRRPLNSNLGIVDQTAFNAGFDLRHDSRDGRIRILIGWVTSASR
jgi:hypothetical protein